MTATALISGASSGIGAAVARLLAGQGHTTVLCGRDAARLAAVADGLAAPSHVCTLDMGDAAGLAALPGSLPEPFRAVGILVNAAGHDTGGRKPFHEGAMADWASIVDTNVTGLMRLTHALLPGMVARGEGDVVNIGSLAALRLAARMGAYAASKAAVHAFSDVLRADVGRHGVRVMEVMPGLTRTGFAEARLRGNAAEAERFYAKVDTVLTPEDVAEAVAGALRQPRHVVTAQVVVMPGSQW